MSLADDCLPEECMGICVEIIQKNLVTITKHMLTGNECSQEELAKKWTVLGSCLREIKIYTKEALKAVEKGSDSTAFNLVEASKHKTLDEFDDAKVTITGPDGESTQTTVGRFNEICEAVQQDPGLVDRVLGGDQ
jgi:hypothetical protein